MATNCDRRDIDDDPDTGSENPLKRRYPFHNDPTNTACTTRNGPPTYEDYTVAWICALHIEMAAARAVLDETHENLPRHTNDNNTYVLGTIEQHNVVIACLPAAQYGTNNAANVLTNLTRTFPSIQFGLMMGIGGGVPGTPDIRLGDVVVGTRVMQYDLGKIVGDDRIQRTAISRIPQNLLGTVVSNLRSKHELAPSRIPSILWQNFETKGLSQYARPNTPDRLFNATYDHVSTAADCNACDILKLVPRSNRLAEDPQIHYGAIGSSNQVMRSGTARDKIARELDVICFEMEAAGLMDVLPCLPIRGICDYSDSHKNKDWQKYSAATAAAYAKELLSIVSATETRAEGILLPKFSRRLVYSSSFGSPQSDITATNGNLNGTDSAFNTKSDSIRERRQRLLDSLKFEQIDSRKLTIKSAHSKTCRWFLDHADYQAWLDPGRVSQHRGFLWISGKPGVGKSTIMKFAYINKKKADRRGDVFTASFFFNARGELLEKSIWGMYRSLLYQLLQKYTDIQSIFDDAELIASDQEDCPSLAILKELFSNAISALGHRSFICFVDALDECDEQQVLEMIEYFEELTEHRNIANRLRICFSSRHYPYITIRWGTRLILEDLPGHLEDMENYITSRLRIDDVTFVEELRPQLLEKAAGVFLWVVLVVDILNKEERRGRFAMRKRLEEIPGGLSELFKDILKRDTENMEDLLLSILWILYSKRPLHPEEFHHAIWSGLAVKGLADPGIPDVDAYGSGDFVTRCVISSSKGLAEITKSKQRPTVQFIHESVRDFLLKDKGLYELWPDLGFEWEYPGHERLRKCCELYMNELSVQECMELTETQEQVSKKYPFLEYASHSILYHSNAAAGATSQRQFLSSLDIPYWIKVFNRFERYNSRKYTEAADILYVLADQGLPNLIRTRLEHEPFINIQGKERYKYPLFAALANGNKEAVAALLGLSSNIYNGVDITEGLIHRKDFGGHARRTPLTWAAKNGRTEIVELLLNNGADIDEPDNEGETALSLANKSGHQSAILLLCGRGADRQARNALETLLLAAARGHEDVAKYCLDNGDSPNISNAISGDTPLHVASAHGQKDIIQLLLDRRLDINSRNLQNKTPLHMALDESKEGIAVFLINNGADINAKDCNDTLPLHSASRKGMNAIIQLLLDLGADIEAQNGDNQTPLQLAISECKEEIAASLINGGANINTKDGNDSMPIHTASLKGLNKIVQLLLDLGADIEARNKYNQTPLQLAISECKEEIAATLISGGADIHARDWHLSTPLHIASAGDLLATAKLLIKGGADIEARNIQNQTPVRIAIYKNSRRTLRLLIEAGADFKFVGKENETLLHTASNLNDEVITQLLLRYGANVDARNMHGETPLQIAATKGFMSISKLLIDYGADINSKNMEDQTPLHLASGLGIWAVVELLILKGAHVDARNIRKETPLHRAVKYGSRPIIELLLWKGADATACDQLNRKPYFEALLQGDGEIIGIFLKTEIALKSRDQYVSEMLFDALLADSLSGIVSCLKHGADINERNKYGDSPLCTAVKNRNYHIGLYLINKGASVNDTNASGDTPLHIASRDNLPAFVECLIKGGANVDASGVHGCTPLYMASYNGHQFIVEQLMNHGADINIKNDDGHTPYDVALGSGYPEIVKILSRK